MSKQTKIVTILFVALVVSFTTFLFYSWWKTMKESAYLSCLASIASEVWKLDATKNLAAKNEEWRILSDEESTLLLTQVQGYDCGGVDNQTLDLWDNRVNIALRIPTNRHGIIVWSNGADENSGTEDDLVAPFGERVPNY